MSEAAPTEPAPRHVNVSALLVEAATKSGVSWIEVPGDRAYAVWHVWHDGSFLVVSGPGEQHLPWLPEEVVVALRSKDTGGRMLRVRTAAERIPADADAYAELTGLLRAERLNATDDVLARWARECTVHRLTPFGRPIESYAEPDPSSGRAVPAPTAATTATWRPWHWRGRPRVRRRLRD